MKHVGPDSPAIRYSPRNWDMSKQPYEAATICTGSFFEVAISRLTANQGAVGDDAARDDAVSEGSASGGADREEAYVEFLFQTASLREPVPTVGVSFDGGSPTLYPMVPRLRIPYGAGALPGGGGTTMRVTLVSLFCEGMERWRRPFETGMMFQGLRLRGATVGPRPQAPAKQIMFVGDSITQGIRAVSSEAEYTSAAGDDSTQAFSSLTAAALGYDLANVGFGRLGVCVIGSGGIPVAPYSVGYVCDGVPVDPAFQPEFVVINLGTNDASPNALTFDYHYRLMLSTLHALHPSATIVCLVPFGGFVKAEVVQAVQAYLARDASGSPGAVGGGRAGRVVLVDAADWIVVDRAWTWQPTEDTTDGVHPNRTGHRKAAARLTSVLRELCVGTDAGGGVGTGDSSHARGKALEL